MGKNRGFSLIEFIFAFVVIAVVSAFVIVRFPSQDAFTTNGFAQQFAQDLRLTTILAMSQNTCYRMVVAGNAYTIQNQFGVTYTSPIAGTTYPISQSGVTLSPSTTIYFNSLGHPFTNNTCTIAATNTVFTITSGGINNTVTVIQGTGAIQ